MPRNKRKSPALPRTLVALVAVALVLFIGGETWHLVRSGKARVALARAGLIAPESVSGLFTREIRAGLDAVGARPESLHVAAAPAPAEGGSGTAGPDSLWRVRLQPGASLFQANYAVSRRIEALGGQVLSGRETHPAPGMTVVTLLLGWRGHPLHEIALVRGAAQAPPERPEPRLALVLYGFGDDEAMAKRWFGLPVPFAVAIAPGTRASAALVRAAHDQGREVLLHVPMEPINYPRINPGPGTLLVTMKPDNVTGTVRRWLDQAGPVVAVANHMGSLATQDMTLVGAVFRELRRRNLPFVHVQPTAGAVCRSVAADMGVIYDEPGAVLDAEARAKNAKALDARWNEILKRTRARGRMTVWVRATPLTRDWLARATALKRLGGVDLAPLSGVMRHPAVL